MVPATTSLTGFSGETIWPLGQLRLLVTIGDADHSTRAWMNFMIVRSLSPYNGIIGRPGIREIQAVPSTAHRMLKFPADGGIVTIRSTILIPAKCATEVAIEGKLSVKGRTELSEHRLNIREGYSSVRQKKRGHALERAKAIQAEVQKLVGAGIMRLKQGLSAGSWRMCVDFTDLNKACPQDCYPLSEIDWKVESLCGYPFKCFLDAYKGYHQIQMPVSYEEKTAFHTSHGVYCYTKIPFGLKNADATYERLVDKAFDSQVGRNIEVYIPLKGIKPCLDKTDVVLQLPSPRTIKEVQSLNGKLASLNRFLSKTDPSGFPCREAGRSTTDTSVVETAQVSWTLFIDGSSCVDGSGADLILTSPEGTKFTYALRFQFTVSNNKVEYEALIAGLWIFA
ncbi:hypothetical protein Tco_1427254 [Tanacetum coccineum]